MCLDFCEAFNFVQLKRTIYVCLMEVKMTRCRVMVMMLVLGLVALAFPARMKGDDWNKKTKVTFSQPVEIPGVGAQVLPAGTYIFKLLDSQIDRHVVQILNERENHVFATILAIPNSRLKTTSRTVMTFRERAAGDPEAIRAWFYPGDAWGQEFVYPKSRAIELAALTNEPVLAMPTELAQTITLPIISVDDPAVLALKQATVEAVKPTGEVVPITEVVEPPPAQKTELVNAADTSGAAKDAAKNAMNATAASDSTTSLPHTASSLPLLGLIGLLALAAGVSLSLLLKRTA